MERTSGGRYPRAVAIAVAFGGLTASVVPVAPAAGSPVGATGAAGPAAPAPGQVALTFDDGPSEYTAAVVDVLAEYDVPATFFVVGAAVDSVRYDGLVERMHDEGHSVQNHTYRHPFLTQLPDWQIQTEFARTNEAVERRIGVTPTCFRPPYGATNARVRANALGMTEIMWDVDTRDFLRPGAGVIASRALEGADGRPRNVLMHDGGGPRSQTVAALPTIIEGYLDRGYEFVSLCAPPRRPPAEPVDRAPVAVTSAGEPAGLHVIDPVRAFDSRVAGEPVAADTVTRVDVGELVPDDSTAVAAQITAVEPGSPGFVSAFRCSDGDQGTSALNITSGAVAASAVVGIDGGEICLTTSMDTHLLVDVMAAFGPDGELGFRSVTPDRALDTRTDERPPDQPMASGTTNRIELPDRRAALVNVTAVQIGEPGYVTAWPCALDRPDTSVLNFEPSTAAVANAVIVPLDESGALCVRNEGATELIVDVFGTFEPGPPPPPEDDENDGDGNGNGNDDGNGDDGNGNGNDEHDEHHDNDDLLWFRPARSARLLDTRDGTGGWEGFIFPDGEIGVATTIGAGEVALATLTATRSDRPGHLTLWRDGDELPATSNLNHDRADVANLVAVEIGADGRLAIAGGGLGSAQVLLDLQGWFGPR